MSAADFSPDYPPENPPEFPQENPQPLILARCANNKNKDLRGEQR